MKALRFLTMVAAFSLSAACLAANYGAIPIPRRALFQALLVLYVFSLVLDWRVQKEHPRKEPTPPQIARNLVLATGLVAALVFAQRAQTAEAYLVSPGIAIVSLALAWLAYRLAFKYADRIGEARFDRRSNSN